MITLLTERKSAAVHIRYFNIGIGKTLTYCRRSVRNAYMNSYGVAEPYGVNCPKCLAAYLSYQDKEFRTFRSLAYMKMPVTLVYRLGAEDRYDLDGQYWYKHSKMRFKLSKQSKYYDTVKAKIHKSKKISVNKKR